MKSFLAGLMGTVLLVSVLLNGYLVLTALRGETPEEEKQAAVTQVQQPVALQPGQVLTRDTVQEAKQRQIREETTPASGGLDAGEEAKWVPIDVTGEKSLEPPREWKSDQVFTGDTGEIWYQISNLTIEEVVLKDNFTMPGLSRDPHTRYAVVKANYSAVNHSDYERYFYIEDSWIADKEGRISGSSLSVSLREGARYRSGETKTGVLQYRVPVYDIPSVNEIRLCMQRVEQDPVEGDIIHRISFSR